MVKAGQMVCVRAVEIVLGTGSWATLDCPYVIPAEYRPAHQWRAPMLVSSGGSTTSELRVDTSGKITVANMGDAGTAHERFGSLCYPIGM